MGAAGDAGSVCRCLRRLVRCGRCSRACPTAWAQHSQATPLGLRPAPWLLVSNGKHAAGRRTFTSRLASMGSDACLSTRGASPLTWRPCRCAAHSMPGAARTHLRIRRRPDNGCAAGSACNPVTIAVTSSRAAIRWIGWPNWPLNHLCTKHNAPNAVKPTLRSHRHLLSLVQLRRSQSRAGTAQRGLCATRCRVAQAHSRRQLQPCRLDLHHLLYSVSGAWGAWGACRAGQITRTPHPARPHCIAACSGQPALRCN